MTNDHRPMHVPPTVRRRMQARLAKCVRGTPKVEAPRQRGSARLTVRSDCDWIAHRLPPERHLSSAGISDARPSYLTRLYGPRL